MCSFGCITVLIVAMLIERRTNMPSAFAFTCSRYERYMCSIVSTRRCRVFAHNRHINERHRNVPLFGGSALNFRFSCCSISCYQRHETLLAPRARPRYTIARISMIDFHVSNHRRRCYPLFASCLPARCECR